MTDGRCGERLLETAADLLRDELLPALPAQQRHAALMVAHAMAIAARELERHADPVQDAAQAAADRRLGAAIRAGQFDAAAAAAQLHARLLAGTRSAVELSNPKALARRLRAVPAG